ncbi:MAG: methylated-DNA--[protein]-cysteine S-methyltransferase [Bryobacteraceae bacterium]
MDLLLDRLPSPIGTLLLVWREDALQTLDFGDNEARFERMLRMQHGVRDLTAARAPKAIREPIEAYFQGELTAIDSVPVETNGTPFQQQVWKALREIPAGSTTSYGELAKRIGRPAACRAVGLANGSNPVSIVVPCHRVIGGNGALTGYGGGVDRKRWLLDHERARAL